MRRELKTDPDIQAALRPMTPEEWSQFSKNVLEDRKILEPLIVWKGKDIIVDGHHRWKAINEFGITDYEIEEKDFDDVDDAIIWLLKHQKGRRNISDNQLNVLIGKAYDRRQKGHGGDHNPEGTNQYTIERSSYQVENLTEPKTVEVVAEDYGVSPAKVHRAFQFVKVLREIEEKTSPEVVQQLVAQRETIPVSHLVVLNEQIDDNPAIVAEYAELTANQKAKRAALFKGTVYSKRLAEKEEYDHEPSEDSLRSLSRRFKSSKWDIQLSRKFADLVNKTEKILPDVADWIMNESRFPIDRAGDLLDDNDDPKFKVLATIKKRMESDSKMSFSKALAGSEIPDDIKRLSDSVKRNGEAIDREARTIFGGSNKICLPPTIKEYLCMDCGAGFDLMLPAPSLAMVCPCCAKKNIGPRPKTWLFER